jgi:hypothetical protein
VLRLGAFGEQDEQVDVGMRMQFAAPVAAHGDQGDVRRLRREMRAPGVVEQGIDGRGAFGDDGVGRGPRVQGCVQGGIDARERRRVGTRGVFARLQRRVHGRGVEYALTGRMQGGGHDGRRPAVRGCGLRVAWSAQSRRP